MIKVPRTAQEIMDRFNHVKPSDIFGVESSDLLSALDYESANSAGVFREGITEEDWKACGGNVTWRQVTDNAKEYLEFFLDKIENERGLSVVRAVMHYRAWKWLLGHDDADTFPGADQGQGGGNYQRKAYEYLKAQIESGEWNQRSAAAIANSHLSHTLKKKVTGYSEFQVKPGDFDTFSFEPVVAGAEPGEMSIVVHKPRSVGPSYVEDLAEMTSEIQDFTAQCERQHQKEKAAGWDANGSEVHE